MRVILFIGNLRKQPKLFEKLRDNRLVQLTIEKINILKQIYENITKMLEKSANYQNKKKKMRFQQKKRDKFNLFLKN